MTNYKIHATITQVKKVSAFSFKKKTMPFVYEIMTCNIEGDSIDHYTSR